MKKGVSIVICCYNSAARLQGTLEAIAKQVITNNFSIEVIIIDNNSSDNTSEIASKIWKNLGSKFNFQVFREELQGLSYARMRGVRESSYELLIFCDDDNQLDQDYASTVFRTFNDHPDYGVLGGWSIPIFEVNEPFWFNDVKGAYAVGGKPSNEVGEVTYVWGAGMAIRKAIAQEIFNGAIVLADRTADSLTSGGDGEICLKARKLGYKIVKLKALKFTHFISASRLSWNYVLKLHEGFGYSSLFSDADRSKSNYRLILGLVKYSLLKVLSNPITFIIYLFGKEGNTDSLRFASLRGSWRYAMSHFK